MTFFRRLQHIAGLVLSLSTLLLAALLIWQCVDIYLAGSTVKGADGAIFTRELVMERLGSIRWAVWLWLAAWALSVVCSRRKQPRTTGRRCTPAQVAVQATRAQARWRVALYVLAAMLLAAGMLNGGMRDVLMKAINICTECIGLG